MVHGPCAHLRKTEERMPKERFVWMTHWSRRLTGGPKPIRTLIIGSIFVKFLSHVKLIRIHDKSYVFLIWPNFEGHIGQSSISRFLPLWPWKVGLNSDAYHIWCNFTKYSYSQHLVILAVIVTWEMTIVRFWLSPPGGHIECPIGPKFGD